MEKKPSLKASTRQSIQEKREEVNFDNFRLTKDWSEISWMI